MSRTASIVWMYGGAEHSVTAATKTRRRTQVLFTITVVLGLHITVVWMILAASRDIAIRADPKGLEFVFLARPPILSEVKPIGRALDKGIPRRRAAANPSLSPHAAPNDDANNAIHPPTDWESELSRAANDAASAESAKRTRDFAFPNTPSPHTDKRPQFGWDYAATHRVEAIPEGGLTVHLNDNCVLVFFPLPFGACAIGKRKANGDLFSKMNDPSQASRSVDP